MRLLQVVIAVDQVFNTLAGGYADETISARAWRCGPYKRRWHIARVLIDALFFWSPNHCARAMASERLRRHLPVEYRT